MKLLIQVVTNRKILIILAPALLCTACEQEKAIEANAPPPNIVFILADDLGWADLPCYGNTFNEAPNLDRLQQEGMLFSNAYAACPVCSPTRASIQAGQYPARIGIIDFIPGHWRPYEELIVPSNRYQYLPDSIFTIGEAMKAAGYATGYFGKWHLGTEEVHLPGNQGYEEWRIHKGGVYYHLREKEAIYPVDERLTDEDRLSEVLTDYSLEFIEQHKDHPFFLFLAHYDVHVQLDAELYNLKEDIGEQNDLAWQWPEKTKELQELLAEWRRSAGARMPVVNPDFAAEKRKEWGIHPYRQGANLPPIVGTLGSN